MNKSRLLANLDNKIEAATDRLTIDCLLAERVCYLARRGGASDEVLETIKELRERYAPNPNARVSAWLSLAEGLQIHFFNMGEQARDRIHRAYALSTAAGMDQMRALSASWLAHMDYQRLDMYGMSKRIVEALTLANVANHAARSRANLVVALAYHLARRIELALPWYSRARDHASTEGDDVTLSALMHNMAWLRGANMCQSVLCGEDLTRDGEHALLSIESTMQFDTLIGGKSLGTLGPLLRAQLMSLTERYEAALEIYERHLQKGIEEGMGRLYGSLIADQAWCRLKLGKVSEAKSDVLIAEQHIDPNGQHDDRALIHSRLEKLYRALGDVDNSTRHSNAASDEWRAHREFQNHICRVLGDNCYIAQYDAQNPMT
jgi:tetratricopeptide (TPR) repeat protein